MEIWKLLVILLYIIIIGWLVTDAVKIYKKHNRFLFYYSNKDDWWYTWMQDMFIMINIVIWFMVSLNKGWLMYKVVF